MNTVEFQFQDEILHATGSGALYWPTARVLAVSDLHLGKSDRIARRSGQILPPYETLDTLTRLEDAITAYDPKTVICLGDSFDDLQAGTAVLDQHRDWLTRLAAGRKWVWIEGNHDPGPLEIGGTHLAHFTEGPLYFRHIAQTSAKPGEITGHYHPKAGLNVRGRQISRACFLVDDTRLILPAFGTYTGGLRSDHAALTEIMSPQAHAILTGQTPCIIPMPRSGL